MAEVARAKTLDKLYSGQVPETLYQQEKEQREFLQEFIGDATIQEIVSLRQEVKKIPVLEAQLSEKDNTIKEVKEQCEKRIENIKAVKKRETEYVKEEALKNQRYNMQSKQIKPLEEELEKTKTELKEAQASLESVKAQNIENETLLKSRDDEIKRLKSIELKVDTLTEIITRNFESLIDLINKGSSKEEMIQAVEKVSESLGTKVTKEQIEQECKQIHDYLEQGLSQKEIANLMYPGLGRKEVKVSDRIKSATYKKLYGNT